VKFVSVKMFHQGTYASTQGLHKDIQVALVSKYIYYSYEASLMKVSGMVVTRYTGEFQRRI